MVDYLNTRVKMEAHDLAGEAQADAGAVLFGCVERNEDFVLAFLADRAAVVDHVDDDVFVVVDFGCAKLYKPSIIREV